MRAAASATSCLPMQSYLDFEKPVAQLDRRIAELRSAAEGDEVTRRLVDAVATVLTWTLIAVCALGVVGAPVLVWLLASGLDGSHAHEAAVLAEHPHFGRVWPGVLEAVNLIGSKQVKN